MPGADAFRGQMPPGMFGSFKLPKPLLAQARSADGAGLPVPPPAGAPADGEPPPPAQKHQVGGPPPATPPPWTHRPIQ